MDTSCCLCELCQGNGEVVNSRFFCSNLTRESCGFEFASTILVLQVPPYTYNIFIYIYTYIYIYIYLYICYIHIYILYINIYIYIDIKYIYIYIYIICIIYIYIQSGTCFNLYNVFSQIKILGYQSLKIDISNDRNNQIDKPK